MTEEPPRVVIEHRVHLGVPRYVWVAVTVACFAVGASCVILADAVAAFLAR